MKPDNYILIRGAKQLLTLHYTRGPRRIGEINLGVVPDGSVLVRNGVIEAVGPARQVENLKMARDAEEIDAAGRVVMPAFIDCHACLAPVPSFRADASPEAYRYAAARTVHSLPASRLEAQADGLIKTMARHGTATLGALSGYGFDSAGLLKILRVHRARNKQPLDIVSILSATGTPPEPDCPAGGDDALWADDELLCAVARRKLATMVQVRSGAGGITRSGAESFWRMARSNGLALRLELAPEHDLELVKVAIEWKALSITATARLGQIEIEAIASSPILAILLPAVPAYADIPCLGRRLMDNGALLALGSGIGPETCSSGSMQTVVQLGCERLGLTLAEAISATTINAAWALGLGTRTGSLGPGKAADLILLNAADYREIPMLAGTNLTYMLMKRGVVVFKEDFPQWPYHA